MKTKVKVFDKILTKNKLNKPRPNTAQRTIPIISIYDDGIIETRKNEFSKTLQFTDVNYNSAKDEEQLSMFTKYCNLLNYFNSSINVQVTINNKIIDKKDFENKILSKYKNDDLDKYRKEWNDNLIAQTKLGRNDTEKEKYITVSIKAADISQARSTFNRIENEIVGLLKSIGSYAKIIPINKRLEILHDVYRADNIGNFEYNPKILKNNLSTINDYLAPDSFEFKKDHIMLGNRYARAVFIRSLPSFINDSILTELTDLNFNMMLTMSIKPIDPDGAVKLIKNQINGMESNKMDYQKSSSKEGFYTPFIPFELRKNLAEAEELLDSVVSGNQRLFLTNVIILINENTKEKLDEHTEVIKDTARKFLCQIGTLDFQQEDGLNSVLPLGLVNELQVDRCLSTNSTAVFMPFNAYDLADKNGNFYGINDISKNMILINRKNLKNSNGFVLGASGSGKSFAVKEEILPILLNTDDDVIIIDPEREYTKLVMELGGTVVYVSPNSKTFINPFDLTEDYADDDDPLVLKSDFVLSLCESIIGGKNGLNSKEKSILDRCTRLSYKEYLKDFNKENIPTFKEFYNILKNQPEPEAQNLALDLEIYVEGSLSVFSNKTNIDINNRLICFDTKDLGKQLKTMGLLIALDAVWNRLTVNRFKGKYTWIDLDEIYLLFANEYSSNFLYELFKRARKWGGIVTGITQNVEELLRSETARSMLSNSEFLVLLNQAYNDRLKLEEILNLSNTQSTYITNSEEGSGLLRAGKNIVPFKNVFPKDTELYKLMSTKIKEAV